MDDYLCILNWMLIPIFGKLKDNYFIFHYLFIKTININEKKIGYNSLNENMYSIGVLYLFIYLFLMESKLQNKLLSQFYYSI